MDLAAGAKKLFVLTEHNAKDATPKIVEECELPLTGVRCVDRIFTDVAVIDVTTDGLSVAEHLEELSFDELQERTAAPLTQADDWKPLTAPDLGDG